MEIIENFEKNGKTINVYGSYDEPLFKARQIGEALGFKNIREALRTVDDDWKVGVKTADSVGRVQQMTFLKEPGLYKLIMRSNKSEAKDFQKWICSEVLPSIRKTGQYQINHKSNKRLDFKILNEDDLHKKVVQFLRRRFSNSIFTASLGELQDTKQKRIDSYCKGYIKGQPDLIILNLNKKYRGFAIEFKSPYGTGTLSPEQSKLLNIYENNGFKTLVSNDYDQIIEQILDYMNDVRIKCEYCNNQFKTSKSLNNHLKYFHKID